MMYALHENQLFCASISEDRESGVSSVNNVIVVEGDLISEDVGIALGNAFDAVFDEGNRDIVLDLSKVDSISSYGVGRIAACCKKLNTEGGTLSLVNVKSSVKMVLDLLMLDCLTVEGGEPGVGTTATKETH
jgi:anti-anti-sigma factor